MSRALADLLLKDKIIQPQQHQEAVEQKSDPPIRYLINKKYVADSKLLQYLSHKYGMPSINLAKYEIPPDVLKLVPQELARKHMVIPIQRNNQVLVVAVADPTILVHLEDIKFQTKMSVEALLTTYTALEAALNKYYSGASAMADAVSHFQKKADKSDSTHSAAAIEIDVGSVTDKDAPVISLVNQILAEGIRRNASDIHIESYEHRSRVRMRVDGVLHEIIAIPPEMKRPLIARIKIMSKLDISEQRLPQDGRIKLKVNGNEVDFRVSTMPCLFGEKAVLRMLSKGNLQLDLQKLGFESKALDVFRKGISQPSGMVLVTGPTGSGKTTTLYSALWELNKNTDNISTAEDPVEYNLDGVNQCQVNKEIGLTFAGVLRTFLRQDPDIILVGEIRDTETAETAIQAAMTGHLVLSTLHTNDAPSTITRIMNMNIEPFLVTAAVNTIVAQRLLRTICGKCKEATSVPINRLVELGIPEQYAQQMKIFKGRGCQVCGNSGYKGRVAVYEVMEFSQNLKEMVLRGTNAIEIKKQAMKEGMRTLRMAALQKVAEGVTSIEEAISLTAND